MPCGQAREASFQVRQAADRSLRIPVVLRDSPTAESDRESSIATTIAHLVMPPAAPVIERVGHIPLTPGGKLRTLVTEATSNR